MLRKRSHWIVFSLVAVLCTWFAVVWFPRALPIVAIDLQMEREAALRAAAELGERDGLGPAGFRQAASFSQENAEAQTYIELEAGGRDAVAALREAGLFEPYIWRVRHFRSGEATEALLRFTPAGEPYGFALTLPEDEPGASLAAAAARTIAERGAVERGIELDAFHAIEASQVVRPGGRTDHTFVYERTGVSVGEAQLRLRLRVAGDRFSELTHFVHVPEGFTRRYQEMRAANEAVAVLANVIFMLVFLIGGCGIGTFLLLRGRWVIWRTPLLWGGAIAALLSLATLNGLPLEWMSYDTATSEGSFLARHIATAVAIFVFGTPLLALIFMAAESLTRRAFPQQLQQWRLWSRGVAGSDPVLGRTLGGYLWVPVNLAFVVAFYYFGARLFGWWSPAEALVNPDVVATYFPWLTAIALSAFSGFWEESVFRAVPLAGAALIGRRLGRPGAWIGGALVLQALVFAAAHADYPQQPAYARVVELVIPALAWGLIYLRWGLLPVVLTHFAFNLSLFSLPLFAASTGLWPSKLIVVVLGLVPLWIVLHARRRDGASATAPADAYNAAWHPAAPPQPEVEPATQPPAEAQPQLAAAPLYAIPLVAALGLGLWLWATPWQADDPPVAVDRATAVATARAAVAAERGFVPADDWRVLPHLHAQPVQSRRFVWREGGPDAYHALRDDHILAPHWHVRYARFSGPVEERAEEYDVVIGYDGTVHRVEQTLPEARPGAALEEDEARALAHGELSERFGRDAAALREVTATATSRPDRRDWEFVFADDAGYPLETGEARLSVVIAGDAVIDAYRLIHVPEEWSRAERSRTMPSRILGMIAGGLGFLIFGGSLVGGVVRWSRGPFPVRLVAGAFAGMFALLAISAWNDWPALAATFVTAQPWQTQVFAVSAVFAIMLLTGAAAIALGVGFVQSWKLHSPATAEPIMTGAALGALMAGLGALVARLGPQTGPIGGSYSGADAVLPALAAALGPVSAFVTNTLLLLIVLVAIDRFTAGWTRRRALIGAAAVVVGTIMVAGRIPEIQWVGLAAAAVGGAALLLLYLLVRRLHLAMVPTAVAVTAALGLVPQLLFRPYAGAAVGAALALGLVLALGVLWSRLLLRSAAAAAVPQPVEADAVAAGGV
jgi:hypothetical protein